MAPSIYAFSKSVRDIRVVRHDITAAQDAVAIDTVVGALEALGSAETQPLESLRLRSNPRRWADRLLSSGSASDQMDEDAAVLLADFTDAMHTRMREEHKYALLLVMHGKLLVCHSAYGEQTITPEWKTIPRMLDTDNVLRFALFVRRGFSTYVTFWEREASSSFIDWLGPPKKAGFLFGGRFRVSFEIDNCSGEVQLTDEEMGDWLKQHSEFTRGTVSLRSPIRELLVKGVRTGHKHYDDVGEFVQDYIAEQTGVFKYAKEYERLQKNAIPLLAPYYDERSQVVRLEPDEEVVEISKVTPGWDIVFACDRVAMRHGYTNDLASRLVNGEPIHLFHAGELFRTPPIEVGSLQIHNRLDLNEVSLALLCYQRQVDLQNRDLLTVMLIATLECLGRSSQARPIQVLFVSLAEELRNHVQWSGKWSTLEDSVVEYKSIDVLAGSNDDVIARIGDDLRRKLVASPLKVYFFGVEDDGSVRRIPRGRFPSDRLEYVRSRLLSEVPGAQTQIIPVYSDGEGLLLLIAFRAGTSPR